MEAWEGAPLWTACLQGQPQGADECMNTIPPTGPRRRVSSSGLLR